MRKAYMPYYISRLGISALFALLMLGLSWRALVLAACLFGLFLLYLHSGWFSVDLSQPLTPLKRDTRGEGIQRRALIASVVTGVLLYVIMQAANPLGLNMMAGRIALSAGIAVYFVVQFALFIRA